MAELGGVFTKSAKTRPSNVVDFPADSSVTDSSGARVWVRARSAL